MKKFLLLMSCIIFNSHIGYAASCYDPINFDSSLTDQNWHGNTYSLNINKIKTDDWNLQEQVTLSTFDHPFGATFTNGSWSSSTGLVCGYKSTDGDIFHLTPIKTTYTEDNFSNLPNWKKQPSGIYICTANNVSDCSFK